MAVEAESGYYNGPQKIDTGCEIRNHSSDSSDMAPHFQFATILDTQVKIGLRLAGCEAGALDAPCYQVIHQRSIIRRPSKPRAQDRSPCAIFLVLA